MSCEASSPLLQVYSTVLYLTDTGGPTVILGQTVSSAPAQDAWLSWPQANNLLCFPGTFLHGVIPGQPCIPRICCDAVLTDTCSWADCHGMNLLCFPGNCLHGVTPGQSI